MTLNFKLGSIPNLLSKHAPSSLNSLAESVLKRWIAPASLDVLRDGGADDLRNRFFLYGRHSFERLGLVSRKTDSHGFGGLHWVGTLANGTRLVKYRGIMVSIHRIKTEGAMTGNEMNAPVGQATESKHHEHKFEIQIDRTVYTVHKKEMTGEEIRRVPKPPIGHDRDLFEVIAGGTDRKIEDHTVVKIHNGLRFFTAPAHINPGM
jgi:hypothetical protein